MSALRASIRETSKVESALPPETNVGRYGLTTPARIGVMGALNRNVERVFDASRKDRAGGKLISEPARQKNVAIAWFVRLGHRRNGSGHAQHRAPIYEPLNCRCHTGLLRI
jgi:hypothetical protein